MNFLKEGYIFNSICKLAFISSYSRLLQQYFSVHDLKKGKKKIGEERNFRNTVICNLKIRFKKKTISNINSN